MNPRNLLITGLPRSGTTLVCHLLNKVDNCVALHEPLPVAQYAEEERLEDVFRRLAEFFAQCRQSLGADGTAPSRHVGGVVPDNPFANQPAANGLRKSIQGEVRPLHFAKPLTAEPLIAVKHTAAFAALLGELAPRFSCYAVVRNPLSVLLSWQTVDIPINRGRIPAAEAFAPELKALLDQEPDPLQRQIMIIHWLCEQFVKYLPPERIIRYEELIATGGASLQQLVPAAAGLREPLSSRNRNPLYPPDLYQRVGQALLASEGSAWQLYRRSQAKEIMATKIDG